MRWRPWRLLFPVVLPGFLAAGLLADEEHWAFARLQRPEVLAVDGKWARDDLDRFIRAAQQERGVLPNPPAGPGSGG